MSPASENNQTKSKGRGGARKGSGRKAGAATKKTREVADKAAATGVTPLQVMLDSMKAFLIEAKKAAKNEPEKKLKLMMEAAAVAKDAAPYIHPRLQSTTIKGDPANPLAFLGLESPESLRRKVRGQGA